MQLEAKINLNINADAIARIAGNTWDNKVETIEMWLMDEFGVYANAVFTVSALIIELGEGSPEDFVKGLESFGFR